MPQLMSKGLLWVFTFFLINKNNGFLKYFVFKNA